MSYFKFVQSELLKEEGEENNEGVCWALSMKWLALSLSGKSDEQAQRITTLKRWMPSAIAAQRQYEGVHQGATVPSELANPGVLKVLGLLAVVAKKLGGIDLDTSERDKVFKTMDATCANIDAIVERLRTPGMGHMLSFQYSDGKGHAMATRARKSGFWYTMGNETFLFDPNAGELDMNADTLKPYLISHMKKNNATSLMITKMRLATATI